MKKISIVGLGSGDLSHMPIGMWEFIKDSRYIFLRTEKHPVVQELQKRGIQMESFDNVYEQTDTFSSVYEQICDKLIQHANDKQNIVYAVPGHPFVAEKTTQLLIAKGPEQGVEIDIIGGHSFLDAMFSALAIDPSEGFALLDALTLHPRVLNPHLHLIITQVYDRFTASDVKLTLMEVYPDDYLITFVVAAGVKGQQQVIQMPLYELDHFTDTYNLAAVYIPPTDTQAILHRQFSQLREIISILRSPEGCPWDKEQTHKTIRKNLIEETYEVAEAIDSDDPDGLREELGDLLMQVMLHSQIAEDNGDFTVEEVIAVLNDKLIRRHPHVFGEHTADTSDQVVQNWEQIKLEEKKGKGLDPEVTSQLAGIPKGLPALMSAYKLQKKAAHIGFDWDRAEDVVAKLHEELEEVLKAESDQELKEELGDLLFVVVNLARFHKVDPEEALALTNQKFTKRFEHIEKRLKELGKDFSDSSLEEMEEFWQEAKRISRTESNQ